MNRPWNSSWESALRYSRKNLMKLYPIKNTATIFHGCGAFVLTRLRMIDKVISSKTNHSKKLERRLVFTLRKPSICGYTWKMPRSLSRENNGYHKRGNQADTRTPYNSWLRKFPILPSMIPNGKIATMISKSSTISLKLNLFFRASAAKAMTTPNIHQINDIHHFRTWKISIGCCR